MKVAPDFTEGTQGALLDALNTLAEARDFVTAIEQGHCDYFPPEVLARAARMLLEEGGTRLEQQLCNLGAIHATEHGYFGAPRRRRGPAPARANRGAA